MPGGGRAVTLHAGEAFGPRDRGALDVAAPSGSGTACTSPTSRPGDTLGPVAAGFGTAGAARAASDLERAFRRGHVDRAHPIGRLHALGFAVTVNTDNRLMSACSAPSEWTAVVGAFGWTWDDVGPITERTVDVAFLDDDDRAALRDRVRTGLAAVR